MEAWKTMDSEDKEYLQLIIINQGVSGQILRQMSENEKITDISWESNNFDKFQKPGSHFLELLPAKRELFSRRPRRSDP